MFTLCFNVSGDQLTEEEVEEMLKEADSDSDGKINYDGK